MRKVVKALAASSILSLVAVTSIYGMDGMQVSAKIPFSFTAAEKSFPAGDYTFTLDDLDTPTLLTVASKSGERYGLILTETRTLSEAAGQSKLVFEKYGNQSCLSQLWVAGLDIVEVVPESEVQREISQHTEQHETVSISAHKS